MCRMCSPKTKQKKKKKIVLKLRFFFSFWEIAEFFYLNCVMSFFLFGK